MLENVYNFNKYKITSSVEDNRFHVKYKIVSILFIYLLIKLDNIRQVFGNCSVINLILINFV